MTWQDLYMIDMYCVMGSMTTVGYEYLPDGIHSRFYAMATMLVSTVYFGSVVAGVTQASQGMLNDPVAEKVQKVTRFMRCHQV
eukprot:CAMPEP_0180533408 /NCGR_PEP_ID=MMETSP1036_2-20121128/63596_1 /TAXON_ID=632150 /ORGANISM="Azadinium spinosum, Strain 3D9" /LENGTH=82 /DNA_ID=CAMNT_0022547593 /DNA_START=259 /DNA_END=504 /DNA_ORIENTATION=-